MGLSRFLLKDTADGAVCSRGKTGRGGAEGRRAPSAPVQCGVRGGRRRGSVRHLLRFSLNTDRFVSLFLPDIFRLFGYSFGLCLLVFPCSQRSSLPLLTCRVTGRRPSEGRSRGTTTAFGALWRSAREGKRREQRGRRFNARHFVSPRLQRPQRPRDPPPRLLLPLPLIKGKSGRALHSGGPVPRHP